MNNKIILYIIAILAFVISCNEPSTPKPKGYNRIEISDSAYTEYKTKKFTFQYSDLANIKPIQGKDSLWFDLSYSKLGATIYCTYIPITKAKLSKAIDDSYNLAYSHTLKASNITQTVYSNPESKVYGIIYTLEGNVATPTQFFLTDSVSNFFRGSFYYNMKVSMDSVAPITNKVREDIVRIVDTFNW